MFDPLEPRVLMSVVLERGVLKVRGSELGDMIEFFQLGNQLTVKTDLGDPVASFDVTLITRIHIDSGAGHDRIIFGRDAAAWVERIGGGNGRRKGSSQTVIHHAPVKITTGDGNDLVIGPRGSIRVDAGSGDDHVRALFTRSTLLGGSGDDLLVGSLDDDELRGGDGDDTLRGGRGNDILRGGGGNDLLLGEVEDDQLVGGEGNDRLMGGAGRDTLTGGRGEDVLGGKDGDVLKA